MSAFNHRINTVMKRASQKIIYHVYGTRLSPPPDLLPCVIGMTECQVAYQVERQAAFFLLL